jgi:hypothetical protein
MITPLASLTIASLASYTAKKGIDIYNKNSNNKLLDTINEKISDMFGKKPENDEEEITTTDENEN